MNELNAAEIIEILQLKRHPEGGYFRELYRSDEKIAENHLPARYNGDRVFSTSIYFMLTEYDISAFHKIKSDEIWHYYSGASLSLYQINSEGELKVEVLGPCILNGEKLQLTIQRETWFGAKINGAGYCLVGCTVAPGFDFEDFEMPSREDLLKLFPQHEKVIKMLTK